MKTLKTVIKLGLLIALPSSAQDEAFSPTSPLNLSENEMAYFVSFSMPEQQIVSAIKSAERHHIPVYINGLIGNDMTKTAKAMLYLVQKYQVQGVLVDPVRFTHYGITSVPALVKKCGSQFDVVFGNAKIEQLMTLIETEGDCKK